MQEREVCPRPSLLTHPIALRTCMGKGIQGAPVASPCRNPQQPRLPKGPTSLALSPTQWGQPAASKGPLRTGAKLLLQRPEPQESKPHPCPQPPQLTQTQLPCWQVFRLCKHGISR